MIIEYLFDDRARLNKSLGVYTPSKYDTVFEYFKITDKTLLDTFIDDNIEQVSLPFIISKH